jgi:hypothetical protein
MRIGMGKSWPFSAGKWPGRIRLFVKTGIVLAWGVMMGLLADRTFLQPQALKITPALAREGLQEGEDWWGVYWKGEKIGFGVTDHDAQGDRITVKEQLWLKLSVLGIPQNIQQTLEYTLTETLTLESFRFSLKSGLFPFQLAGRLQADPRGSSRKRMVLKIQSGGREQEQEIYLAEAPFILGQTKLHFVSQGLEKGKKYRIPVFDPASMISAEMIAEVEVLDRLKIGGEERELYRVRQEFRGVEVKSWIDRNGRIWKEESPLGFTLVRESKHEARYQNWSPGKVVDLISLTAVPSDREIAAPRSARFLRVRLRSASLQGLKIEGDRQSLSGDEVTVKREDLPPRTSVTRGLAEEEGREYLRATPFIQSDDPAIRRLAGEIIGDARDPREQAGRINEWVYRNIRKQPVVSIPSALEVLRQKTGDCNEHAALFAALARAAGIPARIQAGIIYQEGKFFYHAWNQVYLGSWISVDSTLNQLPADATHIRLVEGDLDQQLDLVRVIGRLKVQVREVR